jgi:hypothetical protein
LTTGQQQPPPIVRSERAYKHQSATNQHGGGTMQAPDDVVALKSLVFGA